ncbi:glycosyltransferase family 9 protein [Tautonia plasticadhaerens]|uniref:Lipopolysaccharide core heptosyltransferase RfaQ n=1 Tax=Tautonia plasticadhaerens TaxID=2527974 RepID=A0A518H047_9BACT|nr:glycosyltransferase family 9 protein [Tautonia plasticadhaerens]QDV34216.1 Lipopolysaccharide core heptosyltransferase RfaQ [Tautonia plasticadhaerens]
MTRSPRQVDRAPGPVPVRRYRYSKWRWRVLVGVLDAVGGLAILLWRLARPVGNWPDPGRILVVQLDHLGDSVLSSPIFPRLRARFPGASIDVLASPSNRAVFEAEPLVDRVILADRNWFERRPGRWALASAVWSIGRTLRRGRYDLGIDVRGDVLSVLVLALAGIPRRVGWAMGGGGFLLTDLADWVPGRHEVESRLALLDAIGVDRVGDDEARVSVHVSDRDRARVSRMLREAWTGDDRAARKAARKALAAVPAGGGPSAERADPPGAFPDEFEPDWLHAGRFGASAPLLAVHLGAGTLAKRWPIAHWDDLLGRFLKDGWRAVVIGGPDDDGLAATLRSHPGLRDWTGRLAVAETTALLERADLFLGVDSGPAHLAACAGVPSVVLFSGTNRVGQWRPWSRRSLVLRRDVPCRPCHRKACPLADHPCMSGMTPDRVYEASRRWWSRLHRSESPHAPL